MSSANNNFLALEPELVARLRAQLAGVHVLTGVDLAEVTEEKQLTPAVHVVFAGYQVLESRRDGLVSRVEQTWLAVVATRNSRNLATGASARQDAGTLAARVAAALMGHQPLSAATPLRMEGAPNPMFRGGHQYLPLAFSTELVLKAG
jgi:phage gp37-like protein